MRSALDIAVKDLRRSVRNRSAIMLAVVAPFSLAVLFSLMLGGVEGEFHAEWAVVDLDGGEVAAALVDGPVAGIEAAGVVTTRSLADRAAVMAAVDDGSVDTAIVLPPGFSDAVSAGTGGSVELITSPDATISAQVAKSVLRSFASEVDAVGLAVATASLAAGELPDPARAERLAEEASQLASPVELIDDATADRTASTSTYYSAAMAILFVFFAAQFGLVGLLTEKRTGTLARIMAAPLKISSVVVGKIIVSMTMAVVSMLIIVVGTSLLVGARWGDPIAVAGLVLAASLAATGIALLAVGFARTEDQAGSLVAIVTITLAMLGGSFFPTAQTGGLMAQIGRFTPHAWFLDGIADASTGGDVVTAAGPIAVLAAIGIVFGGLGLTRMRRVLVS